MIRKLLYHSVFFRLRFRPVLVVVVLSQFSGCVDHNFEDLDNYISEVNSRPKSTIEPLPEIKVVEAYIFEPEGLRDPFQAIAIETGVGDDSLEGLRPDSSRRKEELESYDLESLQMVGTLSIKGELWGLIRLGDGSNSVYRVHVGNYMGKNNGKIIRITENRIELIEIVPDQNKSGVWIEKLAEKELIE